MLADPRIQPRKCCCEPVERINDRITGEVVVIWCTHCNWTYDLRSDEEMPELDFDTEKAKRLIDDMLNPEMFGHKLNGEIRDRARECKGLEAVEGWKYQDRLRQTNRHPISIKGDGVSACDLEGRG